MKIRPPHSRWPWKPSYSCIRLCLHCEWYSSTLYAFSFISPTSISWSWLLLSTKERVRRENAKENELRSTSYWQTWLSWSLSWSPTTWCTLTWQWIWKGPRFCTWYRSASQAPPFPGGRCWTGVPKLWVHEIETVTNVFNRPGHRGIRLRAWAFSNHEKLVRMLMQRMLRLFSRDVYFEIDPCVVLGRKCILHWNDRSRSMPYILGWRGTWHFGHAWPFSKVTYSGSRGTRRIWSVLSFGSGCIDLPCSWTIWLLPGNNNS